MEAPARFVRCRCRCDRGLACFRAIWIVVLVDLFGRFVDFDCRLVSSRQLCFSEKQVWFFGFFFFCLSILALFTIHIWLFLCV